MAEYTAQQLLDIVNTVHVAEGNARAIKSSPDFIAMR